MTTDTDTGTGTGNGTSKGNGAALATVGTRPPLVDSTQARRVRHGRDVEPRRRETVAVFAVAAVGYLLLGSWLVSDLHLVGFETLEHLNRALMLWHNDPTKLAAIGVDGPPLLTAALAPVTIVAPLASSLAVVAVVSGCALAGALTVLNTLMRRCGLELWMRLLVLLAVGLNPMWVFQATSGRPQVIATLLLIAAIGSLLAWYLTADIRFVLGAGVLFGVMFLASYAAVFWAIAAAVLVTAVLARARSTGREIEGTLIGFGMPLSYLGAGWLALVAIAVGNPLQLVERTAVPAPGLIEVLDDTFALVVATSPATFVVLPLLVLTAVLRKDLPSWLLAASVVIAAALPGAAVLARLTADPFAHHHGLPLFALTIVGAVWMIGVWPDSRGPAVLVLVVALVASLPLVWQQMKTYPYLGTESNFIHALSTREVQEGRTSRSGNVVGIGDELAMATYLKEHLSAHSSVLTDDAQTYAVMLLTGRPWLFVDRVDHGDAAWLEARDDPDPQITHVLVSTQPDDLIATARPELADEKSDAVVFRTDRYLLVEIDHSARADVGDPSEPSEGAS